ncbi:hypothetical protein ACHAXT_009365 [Thalassiosira profunda]
MGAASPPQQGVDPQLAERALRALLKHHASSTSDKDQLLGDDLDVQVQFTLAKVPGRTGPKPIRVEIPHPLVRVALTGDASATDDEDYLQDAECCLIVKEESKPWVQDLVARFPAELKCVKKVLGLQSLRTKHKSFAQRRELLDRFDVFFADDRILPMLSKALGSKFFERKKQPIPVRLTRREALPFMIQKCLRSTFMYLSAGTCLTVKAGNTAMPPVKLLANIEAVCAGVPAKVPRKWANVQSIAVKTASSVALPIYNKTPQELELIMKLASEEKESKKEVDDGEKKEEGEREEKKRKKDTALAKALKKQKTAEKEAAEEADAAKSEEKKPEKKSAKKKKRKESVDEEVDAETPVAKKTPKSSKKKRKESVDEEVAEAKPSKSAKKQKKADTAATTTPKDANFLPSKRFAGAKKGFVFKKGKSGTGYYRDVLPRVDKAFLASLTKRGGGGRKSMGGSMKKRKGGKSRRSY